MLKKLYVGLYNLILLIGIVVLSPLWLLWLIRVPKIRTGFWQKLGFFPRCLQQQLEQQASHAPIWIHTVSVGELNAAQNLIERLSKNGHALVISCTTATGYALAQKTHATLPLLYCPFDFPWGVNVALRLIRPKMLLILETEIWPNLVFAANHRHIPVILANGRLSEKSYRGYRRFKPFFNCVLSQFTQLIMQTAQDQDRIQRLGAPPEKVWVAGNIKYDTAALRIADCPPALNHHFGMPGQYQTLIFGSTHAGEDSLFIDLYLRLKTTFPALKAVIAPRHPERIPEVFKRLQDQVTEPFCLRSQMAQLNATLGTHDVVLVDTIGELRWLYALGTVACIGGSFVPWGGHNPLEPLQANIPVVFGPHMQNFKEMVQKLTATQSGFQADTIESAYTILHQLLSHPDFYDQTRQNGQALLEANRGASDRIVHEIEQTLLNP